MRWQGERGKPPRLLVADRAPLVAAAIAAMLRGKGYDIVAEAHDGAEAEAFLAAGAVDVAIIDIDIVAPGPLVLLALLDGRRARLPVAIMAPFPDHPLISGVVQSSADGLVLKSEHPDNLLHCLATISAGGRWFDHLAVAYALDRVDAFNGAAALTRRERDVARLVATGQRNRAIAGSLGISEGTVKMHLHNVYSKLGLESRTQLAMDERLRVLG